MLTWIHFYFFFFQAEDDIRDLTVSGVQTCAHPICGFSRSTYLLFFFASWPSTQQKCFSLYFCANFLPIKAQSAYQKLKRRSEERRVGKECRYQWWPCH